MATAAKDQNNAGSYLTVSQKYFEMTARIFKGLPRHQRKEFLEVGVRVMMMV